MGELSLFLAFWTPGPVELIVLAVVGVLIFGKRLPEVGKSLGKGIVEFKRGVAGVTDEINEQSNKSGSQIEDQANQAEFEGSDPQGQPQSQSNSSGAST